MPTDVRRKQNAMKLWLVLLVCVVIFYVDASSLPLPLDCETYCPPGTYCDGEKCPDCTFGTFQDKKHYVGTSCIPWSQSPGHTWVVTKNGSHTNDVEYGCKEGLVRGYLTSFHSKEVCSEITTVSMTTVLPTINSVDSENEKSTTEKDGNDIDGATIAYIIVGIVIIIVIVVVVVVVIYCRKKETGFKRISKNDYTDLARFLWDNLGKSRLNTFLTSISFKEHNDEISSQEDFLNRLNKWEVDNPNREVLDLFENGKYKELNRDIYDNPKYIEIGRKLKNLKPVDKSLNEGELLSDSLITNLFNLIYAEIDQPKNFFNKLNHRDGFNMNIRINRTQIVEIGDFINLGHEWIRWHRGWNHVNYIKTALKDSGSTFVLLNEKFKELTETETTEDENSRNSLISVENGSRDGVTATGVSSAGSGDGVTATGVSSAGSRDGVTATGVSSAGSRDGVTATGVSSAGSRDGVTATGVSSAGSGDGKTATGVSSVGLTAENVDNTMV